MIMTKDEVFSKSKKWKSALENQTGKRLRCLRTYNGLEFCNHQFDDYCRDKGIRRHKTCTYTPQQNGVAERMNRTIMEKVRCMLAESGLEQMFWAEAASTAIHLINRTPSSAINSRLPEQMWTGFKPDLSHLRRFGCSAFVHMKQGKTKPRSIKGVFVGYPFGVKGYKIWFPEDGSFTTSRNVVFNEDELFKDTLQKDNRNASDSEKEITWAEKKAGKRVSFSDVLIRGPSPGYSEEGELTAQGGVDLGSENLQNSETSENSEIPEYEEADQIVEEADQIGNETIQINNEAENEQSLDDYVLARDRTRRAIRPPSRYEDSDFVAYALAAADDLEVDEPRTYGEAMRSQDRKHWKNATLEEMDSHKKNQTWVLIDRPAKQKIIGCKWVFKLKPGILGVEK